MNPSQKGSAQRRPPIGITPDVTSRPENRPLYELKVAYADAVLRAGGLPLVLPYTEEANGVEGYLDRICGLLVTGGAFDIPPEAYGDVRKEGLGQLKPGRTSFETALLKGALRRKLPVLGICGGMQLLNVALGGTLVQDIAKEIEKAQDHEQKSDRSQPHHPVEVKQGTFLAELLGEGQLMVNSTHHQAVKKLGSGLVTSAVASDGVVEAIEVKDAGFAVGVQWHPELLLDSVPTHLALYRGLVQRAREIRR